MPNAGIHGVPLDELELGGAGVEASPDRERDDERRERDDRASATGSAPLRRPSALPIEQQQQRAGHRQQPRDESNGTFNQSP